MTTRKILFLVALLTCGVAASGQGNVQQSPVDMERVLLPLTVIDSQGAYGTRWSTELWLRMHAGDAFPVFAPSACDPPCPDLFVIGDGSFRSDFFRTHPNETAGELLYVNRSATDSISISLRLVELSGKTAFVPLQLPVVRERDFKKTSLNLLGIPVLANSRAMLRVYGIDPTAVGEVRIKIFSEESTAEQNVLDDRMLSLTVTQKQYVVGGNTFDIRPPTAQIDLTRIIPAGTQMIRLEITPTTPDVAIWGFVSITDNATQIVTLRTPN